MIKLSCEGASVINWRFGRIRPLQPPPQASESDAPQSPDLIEVFLERSINTDQRDLLYVGFFIRIASTSRDRIFPLKRPCHYYGNSFATRLSFNCFCIIWWVAVEFRSSANIEMVRQRFQLLPPQQHRPLHSQFTRSASAFAAATELYVLVARIWRLRFVHPG